MHRIRLFLLCSIAPFFMLVEPNGAAGEQRSPTDAAPAPKWKFHTRGPVVGSPVIDGELVYFGSGDSVLYALDLETGTIRWSSMTRGPIRSTVAVEGEKVFLVGGDGVVYAFEKNSGKILWTFKTAGEKFSKYYSYADYYCSSPVVQDGMLYFGSGDGNVYALKSIDGKLVWRFTTGDVVHASPVIDQDKLYVGSFDGSLYALERRTGALAWKFKSVGHRFFPAGEMQGTPVLANGLVYVGSRDYNLYAIDTGKGYCHWNRQFPKGWAMALATNDTVLYVGTSDDDLLLALDGRTGKELWTTDVKFNIFGSPSFDRSMIYVGTLLGKLLGVDLRTGAIRSTFNTDGYNEHHVKYFPSESAIVKNDFYAIVQSPEGYINALHALGAIFSTPAVSDDLVIVSSTDGTVYCLQR